MANGNTTRIPIPDDLTPETEERFRGWYMEVSLLNDNTVPPGIYAVLESAARNWQAGRRMRRMTEDAFAAGDIRIAMAMEIQARQNEVAVRMALSSIRLIGSDRGSRSIEKSSRAATLTGSVVPSNKWSQIPSVTTN